jgi:chromosome segregation ATPase
MIIRNLITLSTSAILFALLTQIAFAANLYRYINEQGVQSIGTSLPAAAAQRGYDVLDAQTMRLIERVAPALTEEQIEQLEQQEREQKLVEEKRKKQAIYDQRLLSLYQSVQDIENAKQRDVNAKQITLEQTQESLVELTAQKAKLERRAAEDELSGGITPKTQKAINKNTQLITDTKQIIASLQAQIAKLTADYEAAAVRLKELRN